MPRFRDGGAASARIGPYTSSYKPNAPIQHLPATRSRSALNSVCQEAQTRAKAPAPRGHLLQCNLELPALCRCLVGESEPTPISTPICFWIYTDDPDSTGRGIAKHA